MKLFRLFYLILFVFCMSGTAYPATNLLTTIYDVNKYDPMFATEPPIAIPDGVDKADTSDSMMCWAASASNNLMYFGWGFDRDADGNIELYDDIYHEFLRWSPNDPGAPYDAYEHYLTTYWSVDAASVNNYFWQEHLSDPIETLVSKIDMGYSVDLCLYFDGYETGHVVTAWGYDYVENSNIASIAITDSDVSNGIGNTELDWREYSFDEDEGWRFTLDGGYTGGIGGLMGFSQNPNPVPIPNAVWLLGSGLIGLMGFRKKIRE